MDVNYISLLARIEKMESELANLKETANKLCENNLSKKEDKEDKQDKQNKERLTYDDALLIIHDFEPKAEYIDKLIVLLQNITYNPHFSSEFYMPEEDDTISLLLYKQGVARICEFTQLTA